MVKPQEIINISNKLKIDRGTIEQDYFVTWILFCLAQDELKRKLAFKGGTSLKKCYFPNYRFSEDLDFHWTNGKKDWSKIIEGFKRVSNKVKDFSSNETVILEPSKKGEIMQFFIGCRSLLDPGKIIKIKVDIINEIELVDNLQEKEVFLNYSDFPSQPTQQAKLRVYSLYEILLEKFSTLLESTRWEPRDLYDCWHLLNFAHLNIKFLKEKFSQKFGFNFNPQLIISSIEAPFYKKMWKIRLKNQIHDLPPIERVIKDIKKAL